MTSGLDSSPQPIGAVLAQILERFPNRDAILEAAEAARGGDRLDLLAEATCSRCRDVGWLRPNVMPGEPGFGELVECSCAAGQQAKQRRQERIWRTAKIPKKMRSYTLDTLAKRPDKRRMAESLREWQASPCWLVLWGEKGTCKTGGAVALLQEHQATGGQGLYVDLPNFLDEVAATYSRKEDEPSLREVLRTLIDADLLVLDDIGVNGKALTDSGKDKLWSVVNARWLEERRTVFTTNLNPGQLARHVGELTADRIRDNLGPENRWLVECTGPSQRGMELPW